MKVNLVRLIDVCDFQGGSQPPKNEWSDTPIDNYVRMLQIRDFTQAKESHIAYVKESKKLKRCNSDDILIGRYGASVGKILSGLSGAYNVAIMKTIPNPKKLEKKYLYYLLKSPGFQNFILNVGVRAAQAGFSKKDLAKYNFSLPENLDDQIRIATLLSHVESLIAKRKESIALLDELLKSAFLDMFGDPVNNPKKFEEIQLQDVCLDKGEYGSGASAIDYHPSLPRYLRITDISNNGSLSKDKKSPEMTEEKYYLEFGDILFARTGATVGKTYLHTSDELLQFAGYLIRFKPNFELINPYYLFHFTQSGYYNYWVSKKQRAAGQPNINAKEYGSLKLLKPSKKLQDKFATIVQQVEQIKTTYQESLDELNSLFGSLSQRAFKGELDLSSMELDLDFAEISSEISSEITSSEKENKVSKENQKVGDITEKQILKLLKNNKTLSIDRLVTKWHEMKGLKINYTESDFEIIKEKIFKMIEDEKIIQSFEYTEMLLKAKNEA